MIKFSDLVNLEKNSARSRNGPFNSMHEIYGVLAEEVYEFFEQMRLKPQQREADNILEELVQISAIAEMAAEDLNLVEAVPVNNAQQYYDEKYKKLKQAIENFLDIAIIKPSIIRTQRIPSHLEYSTTLLDITIKKEDLETLKEIVYDN